MAHIVPIERLPFRLLAPSFEEEVLPGDDPRAFVIPLPFDVRQGSILVGQVHAFLIQVDLAESKGVSVFDLFDSVDQDLHELYAAIYDTKTEEIREDLVDPAGPVNVLYIDTVKLVPSRRGKLLGLRIIERIRDLFGGGCCAIALKAFPLTTKRTKYPDAVDDEVFAQAFEAKGDEARSKLRAYWSKLGFKRVDETSYMIFDLSEEPPTL